MPRKLKVLGVALFAILTMSVAVAAAQAEKFTSATYPAKITGEQVWPHEFQTTHAGVECEVTKFSGEMTAASETLTLTPTYEKCLVGGAIPATVDMNGCDFLIHTTSVDSVDVVCPTTLINLKLITDAIDITVPATGCTMVIPEQTGLHTISMVNRPDGTITAFVHLSSIKYSQNSKCPGGELSEDAGGSYDGEVDFAGNKGAISID